MAFIAKTAGDRNENNILFSSILFSHDLNVDVDIKNTYKLVYNKNHWHIITQFDNDLYLNFSENS